MGGRRSHYGALVQSHFDALVLAVLNLVFTLDQVTGNRVIAVGLCKPVFEAFDNMSHLGLIYKFD